MNYTLVKIWWLENTFEFQDQFGNSNVKFDYDRMYFHEFVDDGSITCAARDELEIDEFLDPDWQRIREDTDRLGDNASDALLIFKEWITQHEPDWTGDYEPEFNYEYVGLLDTTKLYLAVADVEKVPA